MKKAAAAIFSVLVCLASPSFAQDAGGEPHKLVKLRRELNALAETGNREAGTMAKIADYLKSAGVDEVATGAAKTGVVAVIKGGRPGKIVAIRAPIDAMEVETAGGRKIMHACGHDAMTAMALGAAGLLAAKRAELAGGVKLIFQPAEEGLPPGEEGGAPLMVKEGVLRGVAAIVTLHVDDGIPCGEAGVHPGTVYAGADAFSVRIEGKSAHGAAPWKGVDAIAVAAQVITALQQIASRQTDINEPVVVTVGTIHGGSRANSLAGEVDITGTLRTYSAAGRRKARESMSRLVSGTAGSLGASAKLSFTEEIPPVANDPALVARLTPVLEKELGAGKVRSLRPMSYADDFSLMSEKVPSFYFQLGTRSEKKGITAGTHTEKFDVDEGCIPLGARLLAASAEDLLRR